MIFWELRKITSNFKSVLKIVFSAIVLKQHSIWEPPQFGSGISIQKSCLFLNFHDYSIGMPHRKRLEKKTTNYCLWALCLIGAPSECTVKASKQLWAKGSCLQGGEQAQLSCTLRLELQPFQGGSWAVPHACPHSPLTHSLPQAPHPVTCTRLTSAISSVITNNTQNS